MSDDNAELQAAVRRLLHKNNDQNFAATLTEMATLINDPIKQKLVLHELRASLNDDPIWQGVPPEDLSYNKDPNNRYAGVPIRTFHFRAHPVNLLRNGQPMAGWITRRYVWGEDILNFKTKSNGRYRRWEDNPSWISGWSNWARTDRTFQRPNSPNSDDCDPSEPNKFYQEVVIRPDGVPDGTWLDPNIFTFDKDG